MDKSIAKMTAYIRHIAFIVVGTLICLELALRAVAFFSISYKKHLSHSAGHVNSTVILCAGDSFVWGAGGRSFPEQIQDILDKQAGPDKFKVVNLGVPGTDTSAALKKLPSQLDEYNPSVVIFLSGYSNHWRNSPLVKSDRILSRFSIYRLVKLLYNTYLHREKSELYYTVAAIKKHTAAGSEQYYRLLGGAVYNYIARTYKEDEDFISQPEYDEVFAGLKKYPRNLRLNNAAARISLHRGLTSEAIGYSEHIFNINKNFGAIMLSRIYYDLRDFDKAEYYAGFITPDTYPGLYISGQLSQARGNADKARRYFLQAEKTARTQTEKTVLYRTLGYIYFELKDPKRSMEYFDKAMLLNPNDMDTLLFMAHVFGGFDSRTVMDHDNFGRVLDKAILHSDIKHVEKLITLIQASGLPKSEKDLFYERLMSRYPALPKVPSGNTYCVEDSLKAYKEVEIAKDYDAVGSLVTGRGKRLLLSSYPEKSYDGAEAAARKYNVPYIDFIAVFNRRFKTRAEWVAFDGGHCNTSGYRVMAESFAEKIIEMCPDGKCRPAHSQ